ncbi:hypothetical protein JYU34_021346 [Plutella xylostella]|uniref:Uncharacterized protein n=1 Tax=Plutella xylostella TaxID=51655 RepID=A0ABQ7PUX8_PLUXY|nr:hypothetical protein JYU34_021346 [Plutella xylostella]
MIKLTKIDFESPPASGGGGSGSAAAAALQPWRNFLVDCRSSETLGCRLLAAITRSAIFICGENKCSIGQVAPHVPTQI